VSRNKSPMESAVLSVTQIRAGDAYNVKFWGTQALRLTAVQDDQERYDGLASTRKRLHYGQRFDRGAGNRPQRPDRFGQPRRSIPLGGDTA